MTRNVDAYEGGERVCQDDWQTLPGVGLDRHLGPYCRRIVGNDAVYMMVPDDRHLNILGIVHGGAVIALLDTTLGLEAKRLNDDAAMVTIQLDCNLIKASHIGDTLLARARVVNRTRSLVFMQGDVSVGDRVVASASGIWKRISAASIGQATDHA